jgi:hypothetical protein
MNIQRVKQGAKITYYNGIYMILFGLFIIFFIDYNMKKNFLAIGELWGFFSRYNSSISSIFIFLNILIGIFLVTHGIMTMYLSDFIIKRKEKLSWVILFFSEVLTWAAILTISILLRNIVLITLSLIGWGTFVIGMLLPIRYYLEKNYREY